MKVFISDCEGPISKNDNAFELTSHFVPNGEKIFRVVSRYDDVLADVLKRPKYKPGNTLKFMLPFLKAYGVTDEKMRDFSSKNIILIPNIRRTLNHIRNIAKAFIISTSYEHYIKALCKVLNFPFENTYCTRVTINKYRITEEEREKLKKLADEIAKMPIIKIPAEAKTITDFSDIDKRVIQRLDEIFFDELLKMESGKMLLEINPIGGIEKAEAVKDIVEKLATKLSEVIYVGDSITDLEAFKLVRENDGLTVSFNGNQYAVKNAEIAVLSNSSLPIAIIAEVFTLFGKQKVLELVEKWSFKTVKGVISQALLDDFSGISPNEFPKVKLVTNENMKALAEESSKFRKEVRGEIIGGLG